jgi:hypothetical protein
MEIFISGTFKSDRLILTLGNLRRFNESDSGKAGMAMQGKSSLTILTMPPLAIEQTFKLATLDE